MTSKEVYKRLLLKVNKNDTNTNVKINKGDFVLIFNEQARSWLSETIEADSKNSKKNDIGLLLIYDVPLIKVSDYKDYSSFSLPDDFFDYQSSYSIASKGVCKGRKLLNWDFKAKNKNVLDQDMNRKPSFEYEETLINVSSGQFLVFADGFSIDEQFITYYKQPADIDIEGYFKLDGTPSQNIDPLLYDGYVDEIINKCAVEIIGNYEDIEHYQIAQQRVKQQ